MNISDLLLEVYKKDPASLKSISIVDGRLRCDIESIYYLGGTMHVKYNMLNGGPMFNRLASLNVFKILDIGIHRSLKPRKNRIVLHAKILQQNPQVVGRGIRPASG